MDHLLYVLGCIEELLRELMLAEVRGATKELKGFDVIYSLINGCCELINMSQEGVGLPPLPKTIREKGVYLELEKEVVEGEGIPCATAFSQATEEETLSIPESLPDLLEEGGRQPGFPLGSFEEFLQQGIIIPEVSPYCIENHPNRIWFYWEAQEVSDTREARVDRLKMLYDLRQTRARTRGRSGREVSGQYRVTVPDPDALDRLRMQNCVYDRTLMPRDWFTGSVPVGVRSLPGSSRESSTEPMDMNEGTKTTRKIVESICVARGWVHSDSEGYLPDTNSPLLTARCRREGPGSRATRGEMSGSTHEGDKMSQNRQPYYKFHCAWQLVLRTRGIRISTGWHWWILYTIWIRGRLLKGLALRLDLDSVPRRLLRRPKGPREGRIFTCLC